MKLEWTRQVGAAAAFTWTTRHHEFTAQSGVKHHWLPFAVEPKLYGRYNGEFGNQSIDVAFTGTSDRIKYPLRTSVINSLSMLAKEEGWNVFIGSWTPASQGPSTGSDWHRFRRTDYVQQIARSKMWISTTGPEWIVGTRYFEVLASGTTLLLCNRPQSENWVQDGLFEDGVHVAMFSSPDELRSKIRYFLAHEPERRRIVERARQLATHLHSWIARAQFISAVVRKAAQDHPAGRPWYVASAEFQPTTESEYVACVAEPEKRPAGLRNQSMHGRGLDVWEEQQTLHMTSARTTQKQPYSQGFNVSMCEQACSSWPYFALLCGGFCRNGDVHFRGRCQCGRRVAWRRLMMASKPLTPRKCESTCSLHDDRPCGGAAAMAIYNRTATHRRPAGAR